MAKLTIAQSAARISSLESEVQALRALVTNTEALKVLAYHEDQGYGVVTIKEALGNPLVSIVDNIDGLNIVCKPITQPKLPGGAPNVVRIKDELVVIALKKAMWYVGMTAQVTDEFCHGFEIYTNQDKNWVAIYPEGGTKEHAQFIREFSKARHNSGLTGNLWKNNGVWFNIPVGK